LRKKTPLPIKNYAAKDKFMKRRFFSVFTAILILITVTACREGSSGGSSVYTLALTANPYNLDPQLSADAASREIIKNTFRTLMKIGGDGTVTPDAAASYTLSDDGLTYTFKLHNNIYWQSNREFTAPLTANDFVFAFWRIYNPESESPFRERYSAIENAREIMGKTAGYKTIGVRAIDDFTLEITLAYPVWNFLELLCEPSSAPCNEEFFTLTKGRYGLDPDNDASNGAFYVSDHNFDPYWNENYIVLTRNEKNSENYPVSPLYVTYNIKSADENEADFRANDLDFLLSDEYTATIKNARTEGFLTKAVVIRASEKFAADYPEVFAALAFSAYSFEPTDEDLPPYFSRAVGIIPPAVTMMGRSYRKAVADSELRPARRGSIGDEYFGDLRLTVRADAPYSDLCFALSDYYRETLGVNIFVEAVSDAEYESIKAAGYELLVEEITSDTNSPDDFLTYAGIPEDELIRIKTASSIRYAIQFTTLSEQNAINGGRLIPFLYGSEFFAAKGTIGGAEYLPFEKIILMREAARG
jgi:oligopeptide transport system substrate-binding protein